MHERLHKALRGTNQTWHLKRRREQSVKSASSFIWYFGLEKEPFILHLIIPELPPFCLEGKIHPKPPFLKGTPILLSLFRSAYAQN